MGLTTVRLGTAPSTLVFDFTLSLTLSLSLSLLTTLSVSLCVFHFRDLADFINDSKKKHDTLVRVSTLETSVVGLEKVMKKEKKAWKKQGDREEEKEKTT